MTSRSTFFRCLVTIICIVVVLFLVDFFFFYSQNALAISSGILAFYSQNPLLSWSATILLLSIIIIIGLALFRRRRDFLSRLQSLLDNAEQITLVEIAQKLDVTPARIEVELKRMSSSKVRKLSGLLVISRGKYIYLGVRLLDKVAELYKLSKTRGEIAGELQMVRADLDKAVNHLIEKGVIEKREEVSKEKVRPSYRRGTR